MDYRLNVGADGRVRGNAAIEYNDPFPCVNGAWGSGAMMGVVMHTMVGNLPSCITVFNNPAYQASADFGIAQDGTIHQFGPVGFGWVAWAEEAGNYSWYSIEHADDGNPDNPLTPQQIFASAQLVECLSDFADFPLKVSNRTWRKGYGVHYMGGAAWGGHSCPDLPPDHVRSRQRAAILARAEQIRNPDAQRKPIIYLSDGTESFKDICARFGDDPVKVAARTLAHGPHPRFVAYLAAHPARNARLDKGIRLNVIKG